MKYHLITYGCQMNKSDSERIVTVLENCGFEPTPKESEADLILINACSVRQSAVDRIHGKINNFKNLKRKNPNLKIILTGCLLKADQKKFKDRVDLIFDIRDLSLLPQFFNLKTKLKVKSYLQILPKYQTSFRAYVPIIIGCNNFCSYCVVPYTRGQEISRPAKEILCEIKSLIDRGYKEIWLLGENVNSYQSFLTLEEKSPQTNQEISPKKVNFPELLKMINDLPGNFWIRFTSSHPKDFSDQLIDVIASCKKVAKYINLPIQSGDNQILKKMNRPYTVEQYKALVKKIRKKIPEVCLSTDVIVGFPGETKKQFQNTVKLFKEIKFDMAYIAQYSKRAGTAAAKLKDNVSHQEKERRDKILTEVLKRTALQNNQKYIGKIVEALPEKMVKGFLIGKTKTFKTVKFKGKENLIGKFVKVKIIDALPWGLKAKLS